MPCIPIPKPPLPSIPGGFTLSVPLPTIPSVTLNAPCCVLPSLTTPQIPLPLPPLAVNPAVVTLIRSATALVEAWWDSIPMDCPRS